MVIGLDAGHPLIVDIGVLVVLDVPGGIIFNKHVQVFLTVDVNLFLLRLVFETQLVETFTLVGLGTQHGAGLVGRQLVRRPVGGVVGAAGHDGLAGVPL
ncbi:hypothetical protein D3C76_765290 [compost metagenome]